MPYSSDEGKQWMREQIWSALRAAPVRHDAETGRPLAGRVLDIGAGAGTYARLLLDGFDEPIHLTAVEIHGAYVPRFQLRGLYDEVIVGDAREIPLPEAEVVILGDVIEHMHTTDAIPLWAKARRAATRAVFLSVPIVEWPQGPVDGNVHEAHLETWPHEDVVASLDGIVEYELGKSVGVYRAWPEREPA